MKQWYPDICCTLIPDNYKNKYLFEGGKSLTINNLIINNYNITNDKNYPFIKSSSHYGADVVCNNCKMVNITSSIQQALIFTDCNLLISTSIISNLYVTGAIILADHWYQPDFAARKLEIIWTIFSYIESTDSLFILTSSHNDVKCVFI